MATVPKVAVTTSIPLDEYAWVKNNHLHFNVLLSAAIRLKMRKEPDPEPEELDAAAYEAELAKEDADLPPDAPHGKEERLRYATWLSPWQRQFGPGQRPAAAECWKAWREAERLAAENVPGGAAA